VIAMESNLANAYQMRGDHEEAVRRHEDTLARFTKVLGPGHPRISGGHVNLGNSLLNLRRFDDAIVHYDRALELMLASVGPKHVNVAMAHASRGYAYSAKQNFEQGRADIAKSIELYEELDMGDNPLVAFPLLTLANILRELGRTAESVDAAERSLRIRTKAGAGPELVAESKITLGHSLFAARRDTARARELVTTGRQFFVEMGNARTYVEEADHVLAKYTR
jgi:tetratricopeptide (TPR) repeat protein